MSTDQWHVHLDLGLERLLILHLASDQRYAWRRTAWCRDSQDTQSLASAHCVPQASPRLQRCLEHASADTGIRQIDRYRWPGRQFPEHDHSDDLKRGFGHHQETILDVLLADKR